MRTLCLPMTKETLRLQGLTKLDQLVSRMIYSPLRAQNLMDEWSNGWPAYWRTAEKAKKKKMTKPDYKYGQITCADRENAFSIYLVLWTHSFCEWPAWSAGHWDAGGGGLMCQLGPGGGTRGEERPWYTHKISSLLVSMHQHKLYYPCKFSSVIKVYPTCLTSHPHPGTRSSACVWW